MPVNRAIGAIFVLYVILSGYTIAHHELWSDELHGWNIAKGSLHFSDLIANTRYEGHPPGWFFLLWLVSKITHQVAAIQVLQWLIACSVVFLILFHSPLPALIRICIPFGYYFLYEYAVLSRNYGIGVLLAFCVCLAIRRDAGSHRQHRPAILYYILLFLLSNIHLLTILLAACLHLYFLLLKREKKQSTGAILLHALAGILVLLPSVYFVFPPADSQLNTHFWMSRWDFHHLTSLGQAPLQAFLPIPAWWDAHPWNTEWLLEKSRNYPSAKYMIPILALFLLMLAGWILYKDRKSLILFIANVLLSTLVTATVFPLTSARHAGYLYIGFIIAAWLYCYDTPLTQNAKKVFILLLAAQLTAGFFFVIQDIRLPFSNLYKMTTVLQEVPPGQKLVTDYWTMNAVVAYMDKPVYCVELQREISFVKWNNELSTALHNPHRYEDCLRQLLLTEKRHSVYLISQNAPAVLNKIDPSLSDRFRLTMVDKKEGALEGGSNLYLYRIDNL